MRIKSISVMVATFMTIVSFQNCAVVRDADEEMMLASSADSADLQNKAMNIINQKCASCHSASTGQGGIDYITDLNKLLYYKLVKPGDAQHSDLYDVIQTGEMPPGKPLSQNEAKIIFDWIQDGFKDNLPAPQPIAECTVLAPKWNCIKTLIIDRKCATCHVAQTLGGVNLKTHAVAKPTFTAGLPNNSSLYTSTNSGSMPKGSAMLSGLEISTIRDWITAGALDN